MLYCKETSRETSVPCWSYYIIQSKNKTKIFKFNVKTQQCINISISLWQYVSVLFDNLQASIQRYEVQSVHIMYCGIPYYLQGVLWFTYGFKLYLFTPCI